MNRHFFIAILLLAANIQTTNAQKVVLHMAGNQKAEYSTQQLDSITFVDANSPGIDPSTDPSVTGDAINITTNSATLVGYASSIRESLANDLRVGFIYCLEGTPGKNNGTQITVNKNDVAEDGRYMATIENLLSDATYYFRSFVYQSGLWFYGKVKSFVTQGIEANFTTGEATAITCFSAKVSGSVNVQSPYSTLEYGICYGTGIEPTLSDNTTTASSNSFTLQLRQLMGGTTYYYRPYAIVDGQIQYGSVRTFRTLDDNVVETGTLDEETLSVTSHLTIGGGAYSSLVLGVCYGTTEQPTINDKTITTDEVDEESNYTVQIDNLGTGVIYYRAYILIDNVPHYGSVKSLKLPDVAYQIANDAECSLFYEALNATGLCELLCQNNKDESWNSSPYLSCEKTYVLPSSFQYCHVPKTRETGFMVMACTNEALESLYGIHDLQGFYDYALSVYGGDVDSPLRKLLSYCIIDRKTTLERLTTLCSIDTLVSRPTEWYSTLLPLSLLKVTRSMNKTFLNQSGNLSGISIIEPKRKNICGNGSYYLTDGLPLYNEECRSAFASERMRMDFYTLIPELENVMMRSSETGTSSATATNAISKSYFIPSDYLQSISASEGTYLIYENTHDTSPFYEGDGLWLCGLYDVTFKLPAVPKRGIYEVRIGYTAMTGNGMAQFYWGNNPERMAAMGIPFDFRQGGNILHTVSGNIPSEIGYEQDTDDSNYNAEVDKRMRNNGFMKGPASIYFKKSGQKDYFRNNPNTLRRIIFREIIDENEQYYLKFKTVMDGNYPICLDYIEFVNKSVYDNPEMLEDIY